MFDLGLGSDGVVAMVSGEHTKGMQGSRKLWIQLHSSSHFGSTWLGVVVRLSFLICCFFFVGVVSVDCYFLHVRTHCCSRLRLNGVCVSDTTKFVLSLRICAHRFLYCSSRFGSKVCAKCLVYGLLAGGAQQSETILRIY